MCVKLLYINDKVIGVEYEHGFLLDNGDGELFQITITPDDRMICPCEDGLLIGNCVHTKQISVATRKFGAMRLVLVVNSGAWIRDGDDMIYVRKCGNDIMCDCMEFRDTGKCWHADNVRSKIK